MKTKNQKIKQVSVRLTETDHEKLKILAQKKGCDGLTGLLRLIANAKDVRIKV